MRYELPEAKKVACEKAAEDIMQPGEAKGWAVVLDEAVEEVEQR